MDSIGHAISTKTVVLFAESSNVRSGLLSVQFVRIRCSQSQNSFCPFLSSTVPRCHLTVYHFVSSGSTPFSIAHFTANTFRALSWRFRYSVPASFLHPDRRCWTVSLCSPHSRQLSSSTNPLIFFQAFVSIICSWSAKIDDVFLGSVLQFNLPKSSSPYSFGISLYSCFSPRLCCLFLFCPSFKIFFRFFHPSFQSVHFSSPIAILTSSNETIVFTSLIILSASLLSDVYSLRISFLHAAAIHSFVDVAM